MIYLKLYEDFEEDYKPIVKITSGLSRLDYVDIGEDTVEFIKTALKKVFNHSKFSIIKINNREYEVVEMVNTMLSFTFSELKDDYFLLQSDRSGNYICDGKFNLIKKIKSEFELAKLKYPKLYIGTNIFNFRKLTPDNEIKLFLDTKLKELDSSLSVDIVNNVVPSLFKDEVYKILTIKKDGKKLGEIHKDVNVLNADDEIDINYVFYYVNFIKKISTGNFRCYGIKGIISLLKDILLPSAEYAKDKIQANVEISSKELSLLDDDTIKQWLETKFNFKTFTLNDVEFKVLNDDLRMFYIDLLFKKGSGYLTKRQFELLSNDMKRYFLNLKGNKRLRSNQKKWLEENK
jgi:hypothetical protein